MTGLCCSIISRPTYRRRLPLRWAGSIRQLLHKYYVDELYAAVFVKPLIDGSTRILWHGVDQEDHRCGGERRRRWREPCFRRSSAHAIRQHSLVCGMDCGGCGGGDCLHDLDVDGSAMSTDNLSSIILTLVTFVPLAGGLLLMLLPRRDRDIRIFALVISLLDVCAVAASAGLFSSRAERDFSSRSTSPGFPLPTFTTTWGWTASRCGWWCSPLFSRRCAC